jgi:hypothetical protein
VKVGDIVKVMWPSYLSQIPQASIRNCFQITRAEAGLFMQLADMQGNLVLCGATVHRDALEIDIFLTAARRAIQRAEPNSPNSAHHDGLEG